MLGHYTTSPWPRQANRTISAALAATARPSPRPATPRLKDLLVKAAQRPGGRCRRAGGCPQTRGRGALTGAAAPPVPGPAKMSETALVDRLTISNGLATMILDWCGSQ